MVIRQDAGPPRFIRLAHHPLRWRLLTQLAASDQRVRELVERLAEPQNLVSYHLRLLRDGGLVTARRSSHDGRDTYYSLNLESCADGLASAGEDLHPWLRTAAPAFSPPAAPTQTVLFVCTGNSARSPIAEALARHRTGGRVTVASAGVSPKDRLHPHAVRVMWERFDIDIHGRVPRSFGDVTASRFDHVVTLCDRAREHLPTGCWRRTHWSLPDPSDAAEDGSYARYVATATEIDTRVRHLIPTLGLSAAEPRDNVEVGP